MYDGNQVLRFENKYKASDLGGLGIELTERKGTGNYDKERTRFNAKYVSLDGTNLSSKVYSTLNKNNIYYNKGKNVNLLNGAIVTSGPEFFQSLGMKFIETDRVYKVGKKKGQKVLVPDIKSEDDIPQKVKDFFDNSYQFLENFVGKENVVYAEVHYDEDTPHLQFYFLPVVNEVKRKVFETDKDGNIKKHIVVNKKGEEHSVAIQKKDENGKNVFTIEKGKFLNCDQFWKNKGGKSSYARLQDDFNKYITEKGFNLFRGNIGANIHHKTKAEKEIEDLNEQLKDMKLELKKNKQLNEIEIKVNEEISFINSNEILTPTKKKLGGYKEKDVDKLIDYSKQIQKENSNNKGIIEKKNFLIDDLAQEIEFLNYENTKLKNGVGIKERDTLIQEQKQTISKQKKIISKKDTIINNLEEKLEDLQETLNNFKNKMFKLCDKLCKAIYHLLGYHNVKEEDISYNEVEMYADDIIHKHTKNKDKDDFGLGL